MKSLTLLLAAALLMTATATESRAQEQTVSIELFYETLAPHGDWTYVEGYGYCWQPFLYIDDPSWRPYVDGYWGHTEAGWTWITDEPFGWATYHYGRWLNLDTGWFWVPGTEWAPAWVSWRQTDQHVGWAPLPPEARWTASVGFSTWTDAYYGIGPSHYSFVPFRSFCRRSSYRPYIVDRSFNYTYVDQSVNITNISYNSTVVNNIFVGGPDLGYVERFGGGPIHRLSLQRDSGNFYNDWNSRGDRRFGHDRFSRIDHDRLIVAAPRIAAMDRPLLPQQVRDRIERPSIDRGWRHSGDDENINRMRDRLHDREARGLPRELPDRRPALVTSDTPPPALGRPLSREERQGRPSDGVRQDRDSGRTEDGRLGAGRPGEGMGMGMRPDRGGDVSGVGRPGQDLPTPGTPGGPTVGGSGPGAPSTPPSVVNPSDRGPGAPPSTRPSGPGMRPSEGTRTPGSTVRPPPSTRPSGPGMRPSEGTRTPGSTVRPPPSTRSTSPQVRPPSTSRPSTPSVRPPSTSRPSTPSVRPPSTSRPSTPSVRPPSSSRPPSPQMRPPSSSKPSSVRPSSSSSSRPSSSKMRVPSSSKPSSSFRPAPSKKPSAPKISTSSKPRPTPSARPSSSSRPSKPQVSRPSSSRPSASPSRPSSGSRAPSKKEEDKKSKGKR